MFASWGHKFKIDCTICKVIITAAGPSPGGGGRGGGQRREGGEAQGGLPDRRSDNICIGKVVNN
jgi:hypothetical protein